MCASVSLCVNADAQIRLVRTHLWNVSESVWHGGEQIKKMKQNVIKMKSSSIICCCTATLQGLLIGDTAVLGNGRPDMGVQQSVTPFYPEGSVQNESDSNDDVIKMGLGMMCL